MIRPTASLGSVRVRLAGRPGANPGASMWRRAPAALAVALTLLAAYRPTASAGASVTRVGGDWAPPACTSYKAWTSQDNPQTDPTGMLNNNFPEASSTTYWTTELTAPIGSRATLHGRYPFARYMSLEVYTSNLLVDDIRDAYIQPDPGQNNPFVSGTTNGTYTAHVVFGPKPSNPPPNTLYTGTFTSISLMYRIYHATDPNDPAAGATHPRLPDLWLNGTYLPTCPVQPIIQPEDSTVWGRLDNGDWIGTPPTPTMQMVAYSPPLWTIKNPWQSQYFPNGDNYYMSALLSRQFLQPNTSNNLFVVRFLAPTFPNTRGGEPVYLDRQVRFWSVCTDDPYTTNVNRCVPDDGTTLDANGYATIVVSDPGSKPSAASLAAFSATWLAWGALDLPTDVVYDRAHQPWGINTPVQYYNSLIYRQTLSNPTFTQSFQNISTLPPSQWQAAMGPYWPVGGYCSTASFEATGAGCVSQ